MITATTAKANTHTTRDSLTYINSLVSGATENGEYCVFVDGKIFDDAMAHALSSTYGYSITKSYNDMGTFPTYKISWVPGPELPGESAIFFSCDVDGGARWFYGLLDFKNGQAVGLVDTGLNLSDYYITSSYVLQNKGYAYVFWPNSGSDVQVFLIDSEGGLIEQYIGNTNCNYDILSGKWFYFDNQNDGTVKAFNGDVVYTLDYDQNNQDFYIDWDGEGATTNGSFQYTLYDNTVTPTDLIRIVKPDGTMIEVESLDLSLYYHDCYIYMDYICLVTYQSSGSNYIQSLKFYDYLGNLVKNIDTSSYSFSSYDYNGYGVNNASFLFYDNGDVNVDYRHIAYDFTNDILVNETITRGSEYNNWNTYYDSPHIWSDDYKHMKNIYYLFYGNTNYIAAGFSSLDYGKFYYLEPSDTSGNTYVFTNDGAYTKSIDYWSFDGIENMLKFAYGDNDGVVKLMMLKTSGNITKTTTLPIDNQINDTGWRRKFGEFTTYSVETYDGTNYPKTTFIWKYDNSEYYELGPFTNYNATWGTYYNINILYNNDTSTYYYLNSNSSGIQFLSSGVTMNVYDQNWYYNSDNIMKSKLVLHFPDSSEIKILTEDSLSSFISLPANNSFYDIETMKDFFVYLYMDQSTDILTAKAYDYSGNLLNTLDTGITNWAEGINSAENRFWFSHYTSSGMLTYYGFGPSTDIQTTLSNYNTGYQNMDDYIWWD
jgi:hypothetical protein